MALRPVNTIYVKTLEGRSHAIDFCPDDKVSELKKKVQEKTGCAQDQQGLVYQGRVLENDNATPGDIGINRDETLFMTLRLPGG